MKLSLENGNLFISTPDLYMTNSYLLKKSIFIFYFYSLKKISVKLFSKFYKSEVIKVIEKYLLGGIFNFDAHVRIVLNFGY